MAYFVRCHCWSILYRLFHWMYALSIFVLIPTGLYINTPVSNTLIEGSAGWPMAVIRMLHFTAAYVFAGSVVIRLFLYFFGNAQERIWDILPITGRNLRNFVQTVKHYSYTGEILEKRLGHNVLAGMTYLFTLIAAIFMIISGFFMLFPENASWQGWGISVFGNQQYARFLHHLGMWWFSIFVCVHIYMFIWNDINEPEGIISSIFSGKKFLEVDETVPPVAGMQTKTHFSGD